MQFAKFGTIGIVNTGIDLVIYSLLVAAGIVAAGANVASFLTANVASYFMNARFTFRQEARAQPLSPGNYLKFFLAHAMSLVISTLVIFLLAGVIGALPAKLASIPITLVWNYLASALVVFKGAKENKSGTGGESL
ncbi:MAG: sugar translocase [Hyphococcus sp.]|nr:MAG: sugar translocase [Marinicaulis sp.]